MLRALGHSGQRVRHIRIGELLRTNGLRSIGIDRDDGDTAAAVVLVQLLNALLVELRGGTVVARKDHDQHRTAGVLRERVGLAVGAGQRKRRSGRANGQGFRKARAADTRAARAPSNMMRDPVTVPRAKQPGRRPPDDYRTLEMSPRIGV